MMHGVVDFSIIIPTRNRPKALPRCLGALEKLDSRNLHFEVIVVDDGSRPPVSRVADRFCRRLNIRCLRQAPKGPAAARNKGCRAAAGRFIACIDDDCTAAPDWLQKMYAELHASPDHLVGGRTINALGRNAFSTASQMLIHYLYEYHNDNSKDAVFLTSNNMAFAAERFHTMGGFDPIFSGAAAEDRDFCRRWGQTGYPMVYLPAAVVFHHHALNLQTFLRQHAGYGKGAYRFHRKWIPPARCSIRPEPPFFYSNLVAYPFRLHHRKRSALLLSSLLAASQMANAAGFFWNLACSRFQQADNVARP